MLRWGGGCDSCEEALLASKPIECMYKGRRLNTSYAYAKGELARGRDEICSWVMEDTGGDDVLLQQAKGVGRLVYCLGMQSIKYMDLIPWLLGAG